MVRILTEMFDLPCSVVVVDFVVVVVDLVDISGVFIGDVLGVAVVIPLVEGSAVDETVE